MNLSRRLFNGYLNHGYTFHLKKNSSELYRNVLGEVDLFTSVTQAILLLQTNLSVFLAVFLSKHIKISYNKKETLKVANKMY